MKTSDPRAKPVCSGERSHDKDGVENMANNAEVLVCALDYIEENIASDIMIPELAEACYVSVSGLQKTFKYAFRLSIKEYILRRRFTCAARDLLKTRESVLDIALKYGYSNAESFTRGFSKVWGITPSEYRKTRHFSGHTPKFKVPVVSENAEGDRMSRTKYDLTELYDVIQERKNNAYVCADLCKLMWINNNLGIEAGDAALLELMKRVESACSEDDIFLRIGGDEFVVFTNSEDMTHANEIVEKVTKLNDCKVKCGDKEFPVNVHIGAFKGFYEKHVNVNEMMNQITDGMRKIRGK